jgi:hypothetical protein
VPEGEAVLAAYDPAASAALAHLGGRTLGITTTTSAGSGKVNHTLGRRYTRKDIAAAVTMWRGLNHWLPAQITYVSELHGYEVGREERAGQ